MLLVALCVFVTTLVLTHSWGWAAMALIPVVIIDVILENKVDPPYRGTDSDDAEVATAAMMGMMAGAAMRDSQKPPHQH